MAQTLEQYEEAEKLKEEQEAAALAAAKKKEADKEAAEDAAFDQAVLDDEQAQFDALTPAQKETILRRQLKQAGNNDYVIEAEVNKTFYANETENWQQDAVKLQFVAENTIVDDEGNELFGDDEIQEYFDDLDKAAGKVAADEEKAKEDAKDAAKKAESDRLALEKKLDWRVRLHLPEGADYLYKHTDKAKRGILDPLKHTNGLIFPYTPTVGVQYNANYANYDLVHSNMKGYFYTGSSVPTVLVSAEFTANDVEEANYLLASLHFLRSCTKMFYGQDQRRGMPPPVVFLTGYGEYQFKDHPCVISMVNYNLPNDVDYIPAGNVEGLNELARANSKPGGGSSSAKESRLKPTGIATGGKVTASSGNTDSESDNADNVFEYEGLTYVPTKISINFTMIPIQTRKQMSNDFSLEDYASGDLLKKGFW